MAINSVINYSEGEEAENKCPHGGPHSENVFIKTDNFYIRKAALGVLFLHSKVDCPTI